MNENPLMILDYHLKKARPEKYLDTLVNLMTTDYVKDNYCILDVDDIVEDGVFLHPIGLWDFYVDGLVTFLSDLNEDELYNLFVNFYAYYQCSTTVTPAALGLIILSAIFVGVSYKIPRFTTALQHVGIPIVSNLFYQMEDLEECLYNLISWYFDLCNTQKIYNMIKEKRLNDSEMIVQEVIDDLANLCCDLYIALGNYIGSVFGLYGFYSGLENILEDLLLTSYNSIVSRYDTENNPVYKNLARFISASFGVIDTTQENIPNFRLKVFTAMRNKGYVIENGSVVYREYMPQDNTYFERILKGEF